MNNNHIKELTSGVGTAGTNEGSIRISVSDRIKTMNYQLKPILKEIREYIISQGDDITEVVLKQYLAFKKVKNFITIAVTNEKIQLFLHLEPTKENLVDDISRDVTNIGHFGTGDLEIIIEDENDYHKVKGLIEKAYIENKKIVDIELSKEVINKINYDNFFADNLESVSDTHLVHPALSK